MAAAPGMRPPTKPVAPWPTAREVLGRGCLLAIWVTAEALVQVERFAFRGTGEDEAAR